MNIPKLRFNGFKGNWKQGTISDFVIAMVGGASIKPEDYLSQGVPTIPKKAIVSGGILSLNKNQLYVSESFQKKYSTATVTNDLLITTLRDLVPSAPSMGYIVRIPIKEKRSFVLSQGVYGLKVKPTMSKGFLITFSNTTKYRRIIQFIKTGSTQVHIRNNDFLKINIFYPSLEEQKKISSFFKLLDKKIEKQKEKIEILEIFKKGMMQKIFSQELRFKDEDGGEFPKWERVNLNNLGTFGKSYSYSRAVEGEGIYRYIHYGDIHSNYPSVCENIEFPTITNVQQYELLKDNDIVFADASEDYADLGKAILIKNVNEQQVIAGLHTHKFTPNEHLNSLYFIYFTQTRVYEEFIKKMGTGVSVLGISKTNLNKLEVLLPSVQEQEKIGRIIYSLDQKIQRENDKVKILIIQKKYFMQQMFI